MPSEHYLGVHNVEACFLSHPGGSSCEGIDNHRLTSSSLPHNHGCVPGKHDFVQLNDLVHLL